MNSDQGENQNAEGSSRQAYDPLDKQRQFIDLNQPCEEENMNVHNDESLDQVQNEEEEFKNNFDLNL